MLDFAGHEKSPYILIVDDDDDDVFLITSALKRIGWGAGARIACGRIDNGVDALSFLSRKDMLCELPAAVILDINMPKLDGVGALKALRNSLDLRELPIFVLTTTATETVHCAVMDLGATRIFVKPNSMSELTQIVREFSTRCIGHLRPCMTRARGGEKPEGVSARPPRRAAAGLERAVGPDALVISYSRVEDNAMRGVQFGDTQAATDFDYLAPAERETVRILLVDDDPIDRELIVRAARGGEQLDLVFTQCGSSREARASLAREQFDLAIVDYWLGEGTSIPLILEAHDKYHLPVVLLTGLDTPEVRRCGFRAGITGYLSKDALVVQAIESAALGVLYAGGNRKRGLARA